MRAWANSLQFNNYKRVRNVNDQAPVLEIVKLRGPQVLLETSGEVAPDPNHDDFD